LKFAKENPEKKKKNNEYAGLTTKHVFMLQSNVHSRWKGVESRSRYPWINKWVL